MQHKLSFLVNSGIVLFALAACGGKTEEKTNEQPAPQQKVVMDVPSGTKAPATEPVDTLPGQTHVTVTCPCFAATDPEMLDLLPQSIKEARRDTALLGSINRGQVYVVNAGEKAYILAKDGNRLQLRFPDKIAWVMESNTK